MTIYVLFWFFISSVGLLFLKIVHITIQILSLYIVNAFAWLVSLINLSQIHAKHLHGSMIMQMYIRYILYDTSIHIHIILL